MKIFCYSSLGALCAFFATAFVQWDINPGDWSSDARLLTAGFMAVAVMICVGYQVDKS
jgi:hypothetical protein